VGAWTMGREEREVEMGAGGTAPRSAGWTREGSRFTLAGGGGTEARTGNDTEEAVGWGSKALAEEDPPP